MDVATDPERGVTVPVAPSNIGDVLLDIADDYPTLREAILEAIQNAIDGEATKIVVRLNQKPDVRSVWIRDNGHGVSVEEFDRKLYNIMDTNKDEDKLGQFGRGVIAPMGKCPKWVFTSCPKGKRQDYTSWVFRHEDIEGKEMPEIPRVERDNIRFNPDNPGHRGSVQHVDWRTEVYIENFTSDQEISDVDMDEIVQNIRDRYSAAMDRHNTTVELRFVDKSGEETRKTVSSRDFTGKSLEIFSFRDDDAGLVEFDLYANTTGGEDGDVVFGEMDNPYRFAPSTFQRVAKTYDLVEPEAIDALTSGFFQGTVLGEDAELHENRRTFRKNDAFRGVCRAIEAWYIEVGADYVEEKKHEKRNRRFQKLGDEARSEFEELLEDVDIDPNDIVSPFETDSEGETTGGTEGPDIDPPDDPPPPPPPPAGPNPDTDDDEDDTGETEGPEGEGESPAEDGESRIRLTFSEFATEDNSLWRVDSQTGVLEFNIRHPLWAKAESDDETLKRLIQYVMSQAYSWEYVKAELGVDADMQACFDSFSEQSDHLFLKLLVG